MAFRSDSKRRRAFLLLTRSQGVTLETGEKALGWPRNAVVATFHELSRITKRRLIHEGKAYRLGAFNH